MSKQIAITNEKQIVAGIVKALNKETASKKGYVLDVIDVGEKLISYKEKVPHGEWENKVKIISKAVSDTGFGSDRASEYMKVARNKNYVLAYFDTDTSVRQLTKHIAEITPEQKAEVERLKAEEEQKRLQAEAEKAAKAEAKKQPEIIEGEFTEVKEQNPAPKPEPTPKKEEVRDGMVQVKPDYLENLEDGLYEAHSLNKSIKEDNDSLLKVFESDDKLKAAIEEAQKFREMNRILNERINGLMSEKNAAIQAAKSWQRKAEKMEKELKALKGGSNE